MTDQSQKEQILKKAEVPQFIVSKSIRVQPISGDKGMISFVEIKKPWHNHESEQFNYVLKGKYCMKIEDRVSMIETGDIVLIPPFIDHNMKALEDSVHMDFFSPPLTTAS